MFTKFSIGKLGFTGLLTLLLFGPWNLVQATEDHPGPVTFADVQGLDTKYSQEMYDDVDECRRFGLILQEASGYSGPFFNPACRDTFVGAWTATALRDRIPNLLAGIARGDHFIIDVDGREIGTYFAEDAVLRNPDGTIKTFTTDITFGMVVFSIPPMSPGVHQVVLTIVVPGVVVITQPPLPVTVHRPDE